MSPRRAPTATAARSPGSTIPPPIWQRCRPGAARRLRSAARSMDLRSVAARHLDPGPRRRQREALLVRRAACRLVWSGRDDPGCHGVRCRRRLEQPRRAHRRQALASCRAARRRSLRDRRLFLGRRLSGRSSCHGGSSARSIEGRRERHQRREGKPSRGRLTERANRCEARCAAGATMSARPASRASTAPAPCRASRRRGGRPPGLPASGETKATMQGAPVTPLGSGPPKPPGALAPVPPKNLAPHSNQDVNAFSVPRVRIPVFQLNSELRKGGETQKGNSQNSLNAGAPTRYKYLNYLDQCRFTEVRL